MSWKLKIRASGKIESQAEKEKMGMKRLTYDVGEKHYCDYTTREIINRLAECEIMLKKIEEIVKQKDYDRFNSHNYYGDFLRVQDIRKVLENGNEK